MKRKSMAILGILFAATLFTSSIAQAGGAAPGEGYYAGAFLGFGTGIVQAETTTTTTDQIDTGTFETERGGLGLSGIQGGVWAGWGMKTADDLYFGAELTALGSDEQFELTSSTGITDNDGTTITSIQAKREWSAGGAVRVGYYVNGDTLLSVKGGVAISSFNVNIGNDSDTFYGGGPQFGTSVETRLSKIDPNLSLRLEFVYTDYLKADILGLDGLSGGGSSHDSEITGHDSAGRIGIQYSF